MDLANCTSSVLPRRCGIIHRRAMLSSKLMFVFIHSTSVASTYVLHKPLGMVFAATSSWAPRPSLQNAKFKSCVAFGGIQGIALPKSQPRRFRKHSLKFGRAFTTTSQDGNESLAGEFGDFPRSSPRKTDLQVVLVSPQIPGNTGCIARSCAAAAVGLHLVEPMGFEINSAKLKRAGLDYWPYVLVKVHKSWVAFFEYFKQQEGEKRLLGFSKKGSLPHTVVKYRRGDWLLFGSETDGFPDAAVEECLGKKYGGGLVRIPIDETYVRCLNLSVAAGIGIYEALRQLGYAENMINSPAENPVPVGREDIFC